MLGGQLERVCALERQLSREHPVEDHAEGVDVARRPGGLAGCLLGRDVRGRSEHRPGFGQRRAIADLRDPEVGDLRPALVVEEDVRGLEVAVDEAARVGLREPGGDLGSDLERLLVRQRSSREQPVFERSARQVLEHHVAVAVALAVVVDAADVGVVEPSDRAGLPLEASRVRLWARAA